MLYGQHDPDLIMAAGLHGLGGRRGRISLTQTGPCRITFAAALQSETVDFSRVSSIRYMEMNDPASGLIRLLAGSNHSSTAVPRLIVAVLEGASDAICTASSCLAKRVFVLDRPDSLDAARVAAGVFLSRVCPQGHPN